MNKGKKIAVRVISVVLTLVMLVSAIPIQAFAAEKSVNAMLSEDAFEEKGYFGDMAETNEEASKSAGENGAEPESAVILAEDTDKREENVKHFRMSDGTMQAAQYAEPVHFLKDGIWTDYDNTLTEVDADEEENEGRSLLKNKDLTNQTADYSVRLSKKTNGKKFVRIEKDGYKLSWYYVGANKSTAKVEKTEDDGDPTTLEKVSSAVTYKNVFKATDLEYIIGSTGLKENLILESAKAPREFIAEYKANDLTPVQVDDKTIELRAEDGTVIYTVSAPFMTDSDGAYSDGVKLSLSDVKSNAFTLKILLDTAWLDAEDRAYPVTVDPVIQTEQEKSEMISTFVDSGHPNTAHGKKQSDLGSMYVGRKIKDFGTAKTYIKVKTLPDIGGIGSKVIDARLSVCKRNTFEINKEDLRINAYQVTSSWNADSLTYNNQPESDGYILDYMLFAADNKVQPDYHDNYGYLEFKTIEITNIVRQWYEDTDKNYGILLDTENENMNKTWFHSIQNTTYEKSRPVLTVSYRNQSGYEDYWSYTNVSAGRGGVASVNNFNGNLVFSQALTQDDGGNLMPVNLSLIYNANQEKRLAGEWKPYIKHSLVGCRMQTNFHMYLTAESGKLAENGYKYHLNDADGTKHWFWFEKDKPNEGKDEDGLGYKLNIIDVGSDANDNKAKFVITDKDETKMYFNEAGNLTQIRNAAGVSATVQYETVGGKTRIKTITDGAGRVYTFLYDWENEFEMVTGIKDPAGRVTTISYTGAYTVNYINFADQKKVSLIHTKDNKDDYFLTEIQGIDGTRAKISYDSSAQKRVKEINWGASDSNLLEKYGFEYKQNSTKVTDIQNRSYTYQFNDWGQTTGVVSDTDGSAQFFELNKGNDPKNNAANKLVKESRVLQTVTNYVVNPGFTRAYSDGYVNYVENTANQSISIDSGKKNLTNNALKIYKAASNTGRVNAVQYVNGLDAGTYTVSAHVNTDGATLAGDAWILAEVWTTGGQYVSSNWAEHTAKTDGWERKSVTFNVPSGCQVRLILGFSAGGSGTVWYDDLQLEKGEGESTFNLVENSGFTNGMTNWLSEGGEAGTCTWAGLTGFDNCGKLPGTVEGRYKSLLQSIPVSGKKGDVFSFGMWAYAASAPLNTLKDKEAYKPHFEIVLHYYGADGRWKGYIHLDCNPDLKNEWQFVTKEAIIPEDYGKIAISLLYDHNVNNAYVTGAFCYKEQYGQTYDYDKNGNVVSTVDLAKTNSTFAYYGNQMAKMLNPSGSKYMYTYDGKKQLTYALSSDGQQYGFTYDDKGNVTKAEITAQKSATVLESGKKYMVVNSYSGQAMDSGNTGNLSHPTTTFRYTPNNPEQQWTLELVEGTTDVYRLKSVVYDAKNYYLDVKGGVNEQGTVLQIYTKNSSDAQKFKITKKQDNTFAIFTACSNYTKALDGQLDKGNEIIQSQQVKQANCNPNDLPEGMRWYFYPVEQSEDKTIATETAYTDSKNFVKSTKDQRGNETSYTYNEQKGTLTSTTDALGRTTNYTYDPNNNSLLSVSSGGMTNSYAYENDRLKNITVNGGLQYAFQYDAFGRTTSTQVGNGTAWRTLSSLEYNNRGLLGKQTYGNGYYIDFTYDNLDRITEKKYNGSDTNRAVYRYGNDGSLAQTIDFLTGTRTKFTYDLADRLVSQKEYNSTSLNGGSLISSTDFTYADKTNYLTGVKHFSPLGTQNIGYTYGNINQGQMPDQVYKVSWNGEEKLNFVYDPLGRLTSKQILVGGSVSDAPNTLSAQYTYFDVGTDKTTTLLKSMSVNGLTDYHYTYDALGNIQSVYDGSTTTTYAYDELNQLVRVNDPVTQKTHTYEYQNGNILFDHLYDYTEGELPETPKQSEQFFYENSVWGDVLTGTATVYYGMYGRSALQSTDTVSKELAPTANDTSYELAKRLLGENCVAKEMPTSLLKRNSANRMSAYSADTTIVRDRMYIESDEIGNPVNIDGTLLEWNGRQLKKIYSDDNNYIEYFYNTDGQRVKKEIFLADNDLYYTYEYFYNGEILAGQKLTKIEDGVEKNYTLAFMYDNNGDAFGFICNGETYFYIKNAQNDVIMITDADGQALVLYQYDAWGKITQCFDGTEDEIGLINPLFYRSYYLDLEMEMYYLNSRYYLPIYHRFLNADDSDIIDGGNDHALENNLFAYCLNNPVMFKDEDGEWVHLAVGAVVGAITSVVGAAIAGQRGWSLALSAVTGAVSGALAASGVGLIGQIVGGAAIGAAGNLIEQKAIKKSKKIDAKSLLVDAAIGGISGALGGKGASKGNSKSAMKLGKQFTKNVKNSIKYNKKTIGNSYRYYVKNMHTIGGKSIYANLFKGIGKSSVSSTLANIWKGRR